MYQKKYQKNELRNTAILGAIGLIFGTLIVVLAIAGVIKWTRAHDLAIQEYAHTYEACVKEGYGMTPGEYYGAHGEYPDCKINQ